MINRLTLNVTKHPNFIGCWMLENTSLCDGLIEFFERNKGSQRPGVVSDGKRNTSVKNSTDLTIVPSDLEDEKFHVVSTYIEHLNVCYLDYLAQWGFLKRFLQKVYIGPFNIQKYDEGGHFGALHSERTSLVHLHRMLVWMTYLNDVPDSGETEFPMFGLKVKPEKGKTLIWPAEWTHAHLGSVVKKGNKYIITGWMHFPDDVLAEYKGMVE